MSDPTIDGREAPGRRGHRSFFFSLRTNALTHSTKVEYEAADSAFPGQKVMRRMALAQGNHIQTAAYGSTY
jgi:hypothetical protein